MRMQDFASGVAAIALVALGGGSFYRGLTAVARPARHAAPAIAALPSVTAQAAAAPISIFSQPTAFDATAEPVAPPARTHRRARLTVDLNDSVQDAVYQSPQPQDSDPHGPSASDNLNPSRESQDAERDPIPADRDDTGR
jgi:hypothetical protein